MRRVMLKKQTEKSNLLEEEGGYYSLTEMKRDLGYSQFAGRITSVPRAVEWMSSLCKFSLAKQRVFVWHFVLWLYITNKYRLEAQAVEAASRPDYGVVQ